jgi:hypothetical protein
MYRRLLELLKLVKPLQPNGRTGIRNAYQLFKHAKNQHTRHGTGKQTCFDGSPMLQPEKTHAL